MPKYIVQHTHIMHASKGEKEASLYAPGDEIDLTEKEAQALGSNVEPAIEEKEKEKEKEKGKK